jgi:hypothetical protein
MAWEHVVERLIQEAQARGEFDDLPGAGKPIPDLDEPWDEFTWLRKWMAREDLNPVRELKDEGLSPRLAALLSQADTRDRR